MEKLLYKYYSTASLLEHLDVLLDGKFWFGSHEVLNDPYDLLGANNLFNNFFIKQILGMVPKDRRKEFRLQLKQFVSCSFSRVSSDRLMWAHYSTHQGFCVAYKFEDINQLHVVNYMDQFPSIPITNIEKTYIQTENTIDLNIEMIIKNWIQNPFVKNMNQLAIYLATIKSQEWAYEQEERLVEQIASSSLKGEALFWNQFRAYPQYVILGVKFFDNDKMSFSRIHGMREFLLKWHFDKSKVFQISTNSLKHFVLNIHPLDRKYFLRLGLQNSAI